MDHITRKNTAKSTFISNSLIELKKQVPTILKSIIKDSKILKDTELKKIELNFLKLKEPRKIGKKSEANTRDFIHSYSTDEIELAKEIKNRFSIDEKSKVKIAIEFNLSTWKRYTFANVFLFDVDNENLIELNSDFKIFFDTMSYKFSKFKTGSDIPKLSNLDYSIFFNNTIYEFKTKDTILWRFQDIKNDKPNPNISKDIVKVLRADKDCKFTESDLNELAKLKHSKICKNYLLSPVFE